MIDGAFCAVPGVGPARERQLQQAGIRRWSQFPATGLVLSPALDRRIRAALPELLVSFWRLVHDAMLKPGEAGSSSILLMAPCWDGR